MEQTSIEKTLEQALLDLGNEDGKNYYANYQSARNILFADVLPNIKISEPKLTDHGERHIKNVLGNAWRLLGEQKPDEMTSLDMYILCLSILFHDVGNINGRKEHNKKITDTYNSIRGEQQASFSPERALIQKIVRAHCGVNSKGSKDTLCEVEIISSLAGNRIQSREIAAILRFADELAEGPQRTSDYIPVDQSSSVYHEYAKITDVCIDKGNERIILQYHIDISAFESEDKLKNLLQFIYERIIKLDEERQYVKFYSHLLSPFKRTEVTFNFNNKGEPLNVFDEKIVLVDKCVIPGDKKTEDLIRRFPCLGIDLVLNKLASQGKSSI